MNWGKIILCSEVLKKCVHLSHDPFVTSTNMADIVAILISYRHGETPNVHAFFKPRKYVFTIFYVKTN